jgi:trimeric autotransporter adhesin
MKFTRTLLLLCCTQNLLLAAAMNAQQTVNSSTSAVVPQLVNFSGKATDAQGKPITGIAGITFSIYKDQYEGAPLWMETQNVNADAKGNYTVQLGAMSTEGLPLDLFTSGEARWLGVRVNGGEEQPRVLLLSVPYALKAADAQTLGGLPPSAFVLAAPPNSTASSANGAGDTSAASPAVPATSSDVTTTGGTVDTIPLFTTATDVQNSLLTQSGTTAINVGGKLNLPALGTATASTGFNSRPQDFVASVYKSTSKTAVPQTFQLQAEPSGNDTATASGTLNLLYTSGTGTPTETGLKISNKGLITFAAWPNPAKRNRE